MNVDNFHVETLRSKVTFAHSLHCLSQDIGTASRQLFLQLPRESLLESLFLSFLEFLQRV